MTFVHIPPERAENKGGLPTRCPYARSIYKEKGGDLKGQQQNEVPNLHIRPGSAGEAVQLREIAIASKSYWGYDQAWVRQWAETGGFSTEALQTREIYVAEFDGTPVAWAASIPKGDLFWLEDLWVHPDWIGRGIGARLWRHAAGRAIESGAHRMEWEAEPNAVGFYEKMGGRYLRDSEASEWGRSLPVMGVELRAGDGGTRGR
jgi:GNAT superfamily N-acetyltransferase